MLTVGTKNRRGRVQPLTHHPSVACLLKPVRSVGIPAEKTVGYTTPTHPSFEGGFGS